ncbi:hypothetical protein NQ314_012427 [Rhamnusium bicolor]|uniref:Ecdysteroid-phosphate phosphatase n=1 Tax=Rhamnusium bicolor TaxID=1586634 RepID=A0AAV8XCE1_9CUCU|nr:hypothetical protein NQ314_012427 [Rhamnusium bicolor]
MATLPPRRNPTPTKISKQHLTPLQILLQMGFPKHRAEKALAATGYRGVQLASDWLLAHVNDPLLDDNSPRDYILYACPTGPFLQQLQKFWEKSSALCGWNGAHNYMPHITLVSFFKAPDEDVLHLAQGLKSVMDRQGATLNEPLKLETYTSPNFMGFFVAEEHADYLKRIAMQYVKEVSNATINVEPHVKSLHLSLAYKFPNSHFTNLKSLVDELDPNVACSWEVRLYSRDPRINSKQVHKVIHTYSPTESDELDLRSGDYVYISSEALSNSPDGWVEGTSWLTGLSGLLPESYTQRTAETDAWTLHKKVSLNHISSPSETKNSPQKTDQVQMVDCQMIIIMMKLKKANTNSENLYANIVHFKKSENTEDEVGDALKEQNIDIHFAYCSPSFRCIQTCDAFLQGLNKRDKVKIKIEPGLFEWLVWYPECLPDWFTVEELKNAGYNIDENYQPFINEKDLKESKENCEQFYLRSAFVARGAVSANPMGNILFVGHAATLDTCAHELLGRRTRLANDMTKLIQKVPYCSLIQMTCQQDKWEIVEPPCYPITHSANQRFDWKILLN